MIQKVGRNTALRSAIKPDANEKEENMAKQNASTQTKPNILVIWGDDIGITNLFDDGGDLVALRYDNWKRVFMEQRSQGTLGVWAEPFTALRLPKLYNLRTDPYERADITSNTYYDWFLDHDYIVFAAQMIVAQFMETFKEFPPRQKAASFTIDQAMEKMTSAAGGAGR
jgi:arylsulfatase A-like enzyme